MAKDIIQTSKAQEKWKVAQDWEADWHGNCINSLNEEQKQLVYAEKMGLVPTPTPKTPYTFKIGGAVLDIGGGAYSLLLKCTNIAGSLVIDPLMNRYPSWVKFRYKTAGIECMQMTGEDSLGLRDAVLDGYIFDEVWMYNVLEHVIDPKKIIENALELGKVVRIFEWLDTPPNIGHPHTLTEVELNKWLDGEGKVEVIRRGGAVGKAYYGVFKGNHYGNN